MPQRMTLWENRPRVILPPNEIDNRVEICMPTRNGVSNPVMDWVGIKLVEDGVYVVVESEWRARGEFGGINLDLPRRVHVMGSLYLSGEGWRTFGITLASGGDPVRMLERVWQITWREGFEFEDPEREDVTVELLLNARDRPFTTIHTPVGQLQMQVTPMGFTNAVAEAQRRMLAVAGDMFPAKCEPYIDDNPIKGARDKDETEIQPDIQRFVWDHLQNIKELLRRFLVYNITANGPKSILEVLELTILGFRCGSYGRKPDPTKTNKISKWPTPLRTTTEVRVFLGVVGFRIIFIKGFAKIAEPILAMILEKDTLDLTEDQEAVVQILKDIRTSEQVTLVASCFNDEIERIADLRNRVGGLSKVCITPRVEDAEPIDAFLYYEGGTLVADNEMEELAYTSGELLIKALERESPAVVAELREGAVTRTSCKEKRDSWGDIVGPQEELMAMVVEGVREAVTSLAESWKQKRHQDLVNQVQNGQEDRRDRKEFLLIRMYDRIFKEIGLLLVGSKKAEVASRKAREEVDK
ncbi:hypothetical protein CBR_g4715 [Chara braunii]|uniref:Uncharacterized protein n=1 Tax=Chara braunii TaxID=69332 RepID=A0A388KIN5_CHABU|nr:hypothetical protein CBR_g4715 [Chara braunii]|eukprot:GBG69887.1 hypothetical protein CBR_g4715 [Chara braunii]